jgi:nitrogen-specific signal transduction histidine kinase
MLNLFDGRSGHEVRGLYKLILAFSNLEAASLDTQMSICRINELVNALDRQSFLTGGKRHIKNIHQIIDDILVISKRDLINECIEVEKIYAASPANVSCIPSQLMQLWRNLIQNSISSLKRSQRKRKISVQTSNQRGYLVVKIRDNGSGIPRDIITDQLGCRLPNLEEGEHRGFGLWIARQVVMRHGGSLTIKRRKESCGTEITVTLPTRKKTNEN